jgi:hypothetical protein
LRVFARAAQMRKVKAHLAASCGWSAEALEFGQILGSGLMNAEPACVS